MTDEYHISHPCNHCGVNLTFDPSRIGEKIVCPQCGEQTYLGDPPWHARFTARTRRPPKEPKSNTPRFQGAKELTHELVVIEDIRIPFRSVCSIVMQVFFATLVCIFVLSFLATVGSIAITRFWDAREAALEKSRQELAPE